MPARRGKKAAGAAEPEAAAGPSLQPSPKEAAQGVGHILYQFYEVPSLNDAQFDALHQSFGLPEPMGLAALGLQPGGTSIPGPPWVVSAANLQGFAIWSQIAPEPEVEAARQKALAQARKVRESVRAVLSCC